MSPGTVTGSGPGIGRFSGAVATLGSGVRFMQQMSCGRNYAEVAGCAAEAAHAAGRAESLHAERPGRLCVLVLGEFKAGKSTLINALLGRVVVAADVFEMTSAVTRITPTAETEARVVLSRTGFPGTREISLPEFLDLQVRQAGDLRRSRDHAVAIYDQASVYIQSDLPFVLIDTPGLGATRSNEQHAVDAITSADVILWTLDAENLGGARETAMLTRIRESGQPLVCVVTKADTLDVDERIEASEYVAETLALPAASVLPVAAAQSLAGKSDGGISGLRQTLAGISPSRAIVREKALMAQASDVGAELGQCLGRVGASIAAALADVEEGRSSLLQTAEVVTDDICAEIASVLRERMQDEIDGILTGYRHRARITELDFNEALQRSVRNVSTQDFWEAMRGNVEERFQRQWTEGLRSQINILESNLGEARRDTNADAVRVVEDLYQDQIHRATVKEQAVRLAVEGGIAAVLTAASGFGLVLGALVAAPALYNYFKVNSQQADHPSMEQLLVLLRDELMTWRDEVIRENVGRFRASLLTENVRIAEAAAENYSLQREDWPMNFADLQTVAKKCYALREALNGIGAPSPRALPSPQ